MDISEIVEAIFGEEGWLSNSLDNFKSRAGQTELAQMIDDALQAGTNLLAEAPTGTGKSMSYGMPAAIHALATGETVVIVTANITLQEQLFKKDLPLIAEVLEGKLTIDDAPMESLKYRLMKGMSNYLCLDKLDELERSDAQEDWLEEIMDWAGNTETGDKSELKVEYPVQIWGNVSSGADECTRSDCKFYEDCYAFKARGMGEEKPPHIIITNYHLLYTDMLIREATANMSSLLPEYKVLIMDEAHEAVDIAMSFNGFEVSEANIKWITRRVSKLNDDRLDHMAHSVNKAAERFFIGLKQFQREDILEGPLGTDEGLCSSLGNLADYIDQHVVNARGESEDAQRAIAKLKVLQKSILKRSAEIKGAAFGDAENKLLQGRVYYVESNQGAFRLCCKVVEVQDFLRRHIFSSKILVGVSATLATRGNFKFTADQFGLNSSEYRELIVPSPFDPERFLLVVPDVPIPKQRSEHTRAVGRVVERVVNDLGGKTMALFTSYKALNEVSQYLQTRVNGVKMLIQGKLPKSRIIEEFKNNPRSVILATASFWQGVDIPGQALSCVILDKFPFMPPSDPVLKYKEEVMGEEGGSAFFDYSVPKAVIRLKQGVGRLIRRETDYGVVVLCDNRIDNTGYGKQFLRAFPDGHFRSQNGNLSDVKGFLDELASNG